MQHIDIHPHIPNTGYLRSCCFYSQPGIIGGCGEAITYLDQRVTSSGALWEFRETNSLGLEIGLGFHFELNY